MTKRPLIWAFLPLFLGVFWVALGSAPAGASVIYSQNFDTLNLGNLSGQDSWVLFDGENPNYQVVNDVFYSSPNAFRFDGTNAAHIHRPISAISQDAYFTIWFKIASSGHNFHFQLFDTTTGERAEISGHNVHIYGEGFPGSPQCYLFTGPGVVGPYVDDGNWYQLKIEYRQNDKNLRWGIAGATCSKDNGNTLTEFNDWTELPDMENFDYLEFVSAGEENDDEYVYFDNLVVSKMLINNIWLTYPVNDTYVFDFPDWHLNYQADGTRSALLFEVETYENSTSTPRRYLDQMAAAIGASTSTFAISMAKSFTLFPGIPYFARAIMKDYSIPCLPEDCEVLATSAFNYFQVATSIENILILPPHPTTTTEIIECDWLCKLMNGLFVPSNTILNRFTDLKETMRYKPPIGYFALSIDVLGTLKNGTPTIEFPVLSGIINPIRDGLIWLIWFVFLFWLFNRIRHLDI